VSNPVGRRGKRKKGKKAKSYMNRKTKKGTSARRPLVVVGETGNNWRRIRQKKGGWGEKVYLVQTTFKSISWRKKELFCFLGRKGGG